MPTPVYVLANVREHCIVTSATLISCNINDRRGHVCPYPRPRGRVHLHFFSIISPTSNATRNLLTQL